MKSSQLAAAIKVAYQIKRPIMIWGPPGVGKTSIVNQTAEDLDIHLREIRLSEYDTVDFRGIPFRETSESGEIVTRYATPSDFPREGKGIFFFDEWADGKPDVQGVANRIAHARCMGDFKLPDNWLVIGASNRLTDRGTANRVPDTTISRFINLDFEVDLNDWTSNALRKNFRPEVIAFLRFRPELLHMHDPKREGRAFPSPRTWEYVSDLVEADTEVSLLSEMVNGSVGGGASAEFMGFLKIYRDLPSPDAILANPSDVKVATSPAVLYATATALARRATVQNFDRVMTYAKRMPGEYAAALVAEAVRRTPALQNTKEFIAWAASEKAL